MAENRSKLKTWPDSPTFLFGLFFAEFCRSGNSPGKQKKVLLFVNQK
jgi:hypothetical protein